jgi:hypothetical protein
MRIAIALLLLAVVVHADEPDYVRFVEDDKGASLETAITQFKNAAGATVDLVGAVHIADKSYYETLNERFKTYDAVLYELVGGPMPKQGDIENRARDPKLMWLGELHVRMQKSLELSSQLKEIDYQAANFVHADMTVEQFEASKEKKNESFLSLMVKAFAVQSDLTENGKAPKSPGIVKLLEILCRQDSATELKRYIGREFDSMETLMAGLESGDGTVIVTERNKIALGVMDQQLKLGKKHLAIFYGAAHLPKMEEQLAKHGFQRVKNEWLKAWVIPPESKAAK